MLTDVELSPFCFTQNFFYSLTQIVREETVTGSNSKLPLNELNEVFDNEHWSFKLSSAEYHHRIKAIERKREGGAQEKRSIWDGKCTFIVSKPLIKFASQCLVTTPVILSLRMVAASSVCHPEMASACKRCQNTYVHLPVRR
jgi:hypothetical protein